MNDQAKRNELDRRLFLGGAAAALGACNVSGAARTPAGVAVARTSQEASRAARPLLIGSHNALAGLQLHWRRMVDGADPLDVAIDVVKIAEADPSDETVGKGGLPNEDGVVQLDAACMHGPTHKSGAVACLENILHPSEVARRVMERTDHCLLVGRGAYEFARAHGFPHDDSLLTESAREQWLKWKEELSREDDWLQRPDEKHGSVQRESDALARARARKLARPTGTIHVSALSAGGDVACVTSTSGLAFKIPGRVGDSPIVGAGLYCDQECGSAGATGRGEASILANGSFAIVELLRRGASPLDAGLEVLGRVVRQVRRLAKRQPELLDGDGQPSFNLNYYALDLSGRFAGVSLKGGEYAVADLERGPRHEQLVVLGA